MNSNIHQHLNDINLIQGLLDRSLSVTERKKLEEKLKVEPYFKAIYCKQKLVSGIRYAHLKRQLEELKVLENSQPKIE